MAALLAAAAVTRAATREVSVSAADTFVLHDDSAGLWTIGNSAIAATFGFTADRELILTDVEDPRTGRPWTFTPGPDLVLRLNDEPVMPVRGGSGLQFDTATAAAEHGGVHLTFFYRHAALHARVARHYACYPGSPIIETWTEVEVEQGAPAVTASTLTGWQLTVPLGTMRWVNGLRDDSTDTPTDDSFTINQRDLAPDEYWTMSSRRRSSERYVPFIMVDSGSETWFGGVQWSGAWQIACERDGSNMQLSVSFPDIVTTVTDERPLEVPHTFFGVTPGGASEVARAMRGFITTGIRRGRPFPRLVTYNTWYADGVRFDERRIMNEINQSAALGVELFVLDAGWYPRAGTNGPFDFDTGLGTWAVDPERFPNGLRPLVEFAHAHNMKFGLWVEPGRVDLDTVGQPGLADAAWFATRDGRNVSSRSAQICYGTARARRWVLDQLTNLVDTVQPDYLKWDNNMWSNCDRTDHDHGAQDGNLAQVRGLYDILQALRARYPDLMIENVSDGGSRIDFGWLRYSDVAWVDDRTQPSAHVRHNLQGLSMIFPPEYLLSFLIDDLDEPLAGAPDLPAYLRSRITGVLGFSHSVLSLRPSIAWPITQAIADYRAIRDTLPAPNTILLSGQVGTGPDVGWDVVEQVDANNGNAVIFAFQHPNGDGRLLLRPRRLRDAEYEVQSLDRGVLGTASGNALMTDGIEIVQDDGGSRAHVLILRAQ